MSMVFCRDCGKEIHESAPTCPQCGAPQMVDSTASASIGSDGFFELGLMPFKRFADFSGRARRKEYWYFVLITTIMSIVFSLIHPALYVLNSVILLLPTIAVTVRRMHDTDRSGWWMLVPIVGFVFLCLDSQPSTNRFGPSPKVV